jgi:hypothetical protein
VVPFVALLDLLLPSAEVVWGWALNLVSGSTMIVIVLPIIYKSQMVQGFYKSMSGVLAFSHPDGVSVYELKEIPYFDLALERGRRVWKPFWDNLFAEKFALNGGIVVEDKKKKEDKDKEKEKERKKEAWKEGSEDKKGTHSLLNLSLLPSKSSAQIRAQILNPNLRLRELVDVVQESGFQSVEHSLLKPGNGMVPHAHDLRDHQRIFSHIPPRRHAHRQR